MEQRIKRFVSANQTEIDIDQLLDQVVPTADSAVAGIRTEIDTILVPSHSTPGEQYAVSVFQDRSGRGGMSYCCHCASARFRHGRCRHEQAAADYMAAQVSAQPSLDRLFRLAADLRTLAAEFQPATLEEARDLQVYAGQLERILHRIQEHKEPEDLVP